MIITIDADDYSDLLDTVRGLQRYAGASRQYLPLHLGTNMVELSRNAVDLVLMSQIECSAPALTDDDIDAMFHDHNRKEKGA